MRTTSLRLKRVTDVKITSLKVFSAVAFVSSVIGLILGSLSLSLNTLEDFPVPVLLLLSALAIITFLLARLYYKPEKRSLLIIAILGILFAVFLISTPLYVKGLEINGIIHRSFFSALFLLAISIPTCSYSLFYLNGATPRADDISRYPVLIFPFVLVLSCFALILLQVVSDGATHMDWKIISTPYAWQVWSEQMWQDGWPRWIAHSLMQGGIRNHILGTLVLMGLTAVISLPIGMGVGIYVHEFAAKRLAKIIRFLITSLRSISGMIFAITAISLVRHWVGFGEGNFFTELICGHYYDPNGSWHAANGSFILAAAFTSLLVIPVIAKATEEGLKSLPRDIWEGSLAVGTSREHTLTHILIPWSMPNIITGLVIGCAEAAGCLTIILFIGGSGEYGLSPLNNVTTLAYFIFDCKYGKALGDAVPQLVGEYQFTGAFILLIITVGLTMGALILKRKISKRYKGA